MPTTRQPLRRTDVEAVLACLLHAKNDEEAYRRFAKLHIVQSKQQQLGTINIASCHLQEYVVNIIVRDVVQQQLMKQRRTLQSSMIPFKSLNTYQQACEQIRDDAETQSPLTIGWSLLYHVYLRPDLNINHNEFADIANVSPRTLRRYKRQVIDRLLELIIQFETDAVLNVAHPE